MHFSIAASFQESHLFYEHIGPRCKISNSKPRFFLTFVENAETGLWMSHKIVGLQKFKSLLIQLLLLQWSLTVMRLEVLELQHYSAFYLLKDWDHGCSSFGNTVASDIFIQHLFFHVTRPCWHWRVVLNDSCPVGFFLGYSNTTVERPLEEEVLYH